MTRKQETLIRWLKELNQPEIKKKIGEKNVFYIKKKIRQMLCDHSQIICEKVNNDKYYGICRNCEKKISRDLTVYVDKKIF